MAAWPTHGLIVEDFVRYVAARAEHGEPPPLAHAADLFLAFGCVVAHPEMLAAFQRTYAAVVARVLMRRGATAHVIADASQIVFERLLVAREAQPPKLVQYTGQGPLKSWMSTNAATTLAMMQRAQRRKREEPEASETAGLHQLVDPELAYLKGRYKDEVEKAIVRALSRLDDRERTLLRLSTGERMSIDQLGVLYHVNRSTVARWLAAARESLLKATQAEVRSALQLSSSQCDSIIDFVQSQLDVSIIRHLS
jgi:RNA polymerase sigma-70 factor, ECF subfamily